MRRSNRKQTSKVITHGCRLNAYESEVMRSHLEAEDATDIVVINTCAVTNEAVRQARQSIRREHRANPGARIVVTGCAAQIDPEQFALMPEVHQVIGNAEKMEKSSFGSALDDAEARIRVNDIMSVRETAGHLVDGLDGRARAYVQVQNGCDHRCTFCIIPYGRGNSRSVPAGEVVRQIRHLVDLGHYEIVLTGVDLTSWGDDLPGSPKLGNLVNRILKLVPDLKQLRLSSIDAIEIDDDLFRAITSDERIAPYLHLSLQSGDNMILKRMKRRHSREDAIALVKRLRATRPEMAFGADIIAGFPTETEEMFEHSLAIVDECDLAFLHVFPFSPRVGTPAARMPQLNGLVVKERAARLRAKGEAALRRHLDKHVGTTKVALVERGDQARLPDFTPVRLSGEACWSGQNVTLALKSHDDKQLQGYPV